MLISDFWEGEKFSDLLKAFGDYFLTLLLEVFLAQALRVSFLTKALRAAFLVVALWMALVIFLVAFLAATFFAGVAQVRGIFSALGFTFKLSPDLIRY